MIYKLRNAKSLSIVYNGIEIKQNAKVKYLGLFSMNSSPMNQ